MDIDHLTNMREENISFSHILESTQKRFITVFAVTRHYGGPEEGGWWYDIHSPLRTIALDGNTSDKKVKEVCDRLYDEYSDEEEGDINSVLGGVAIAAYETDVPLPPPPPRPHYC